MLALSHATNNEGCPVDMSWKCSVCNIEDDNLPLCFSSQAPWFLLVGESEFDKRVDLTLDQCVVDEKAFFIRGLIEIPIHNYSEPLSFSVWSSLSEQSFIHISERWEAFDRAFDPPYFGWLSTSISAYPETINLKLSIQPSSPGLTPLFSVEVTDHPLSLDQQNGISITRWHELAHSLLHS
jgi:hypothetical protein